MTSRRAIDVSELPDHGFGSRSVISVMSAQAVSAASPIAYSVC